MQLLEESLTNVDYRTELSFTVDNIVGRETRVRAEYVGGKVFSIAVVRPDGKVELITRFGEDTSGVLRMEPLELVSIYQIIKLVYLRVIVDGDQNWLLFRRRESTSSG